MNKNVKGSEEKYKILFESVKDIVVLLDKKGRIIDINSAVKKLTGFSQREIKGRHFKECKFINFKSRRIIAEYFRKRLKGIETPPYEIEGVSKDGKKLIVEINASPFIKNGEIVGSLAILRDITERKQVDRARTEFISLASHQLRTPLATVNWYAEMLLAGKAGNLNAQQRRYFEKIYAVNQGLIKLANLLLNVSRIELGALVIEPKPINLIEVVDIVFGEFLPKIKNKKLKVRKIYDKNLPIINADPNIVHIILQNLLSNAIEYTPEGGRVGLLIKKQKSNVLIKVSDTGYGIPKVQQSQVFTKFFRADNIREKELDGAGLGLYFVKSVLEQSGGKIWFKSEENKGTTFYVTLPLRGMKTKGGIKRLNI